MGTGFRGRIRGPMSETPSPAFEKGQWVPLRRTGVAASQRVDYREWHIVIGQRSVGLTVRRTSFTASLTSKYPPFQQGLGPFYSRDSAIAASRDWIDTWHQSHAHLLSSDSVWELRRKRMSQRLIKLRNKTPHS